MKIGDRVQTPPIEGVVIGSARRFDGCELMVIETEDKQVYLRQAKDFTVVGEAPAFATAFPDEIQPAAPPPPPDLPFEFFIPLTAAKAKPLKPGSFFHEARLRYLPERPQQSWIVDPVNVEVEFHGSTHGDIDNLCKPVLDLLKRSVIRDDVQVKKLGAEFLRNSPKQGFRVRITKHEPRQES